MYVIKHIPEDFQVFEIFEPRTGKGSFTYFSVQKRNYATFDAVRMIAGRLGVPMKKIGFAGSKDKRAVTFQYMSVPGDCRSRLEKIDIPDIRIDVKGMSDKPISLGDHEGNRFSITVRNLDDRDIEKLRSKAGSRKRLAFINLFGRQRLSTNNIETGRCILQRDFKKACEFINDPKIQEHLAEHPNDFINAIKLQPRRLVSFYIHAYQSYIWNRCAVKVDEDEIPIVGYATEFRNKEIKRIVTDIFERDSITQRDFIMREFENMFTEGETRKRTVFAEDLSIDGISEDEFFDSRKKAVLSFSLPKGSYATVFIDSLFG